MHLQDRRRLPGGDRAARSPGGPSAGLRARRFRPRGTICSRQAAHHSRRTAMKPETVGMSATRLARLDEVMKRRYVDSGYLPGILTYVYRKGHLVYTGMCGSMDI